MKNSFVLYTEYAEYLSMLSTEQCGLLFTAILAYAADEPIPEMDDLTKMAFLGISLQIKHEKELTARHDEEIKALQQEHEKELSDLREEIEEERVRFSEYGKKGGRPKKKTSETPFSENENPLKTPFSEEETPLKPPFNPLSENKNPLFKIENPLFEEKEGSLQEKEGGKERSKEKPQEREYTLQEKERPPYNPPAGEDGTDGSVILSDDDDLAETVRGYKAFLAEFPSVSVDIMNAGELATVDFAVLSERMRESAFLKTRYSLRWLIRHFPEIKAGAYADFPKRREREDPPPNPLFDKYFPEEDVLQ